MKYELYEGTPQEIAELKNIMDSNKHQPITEVTVNCFGSPNNVQAEIRKVFERLNTSLASQW